MKNSTKKTKNEQTLTLKYVKIKNHGLKAEYMLVMRYYKKISLLY